MESSLLGIAGGTAGLALTAALHLALPSLLPADFPRLQDIAVDWRVIVFSSVVAVAAGLAFGVLPALQVRRLTLVEALTEDSLAPVGTAGRSSVGRTRALMASIVVYSVATFACGLVTSVWQLAAARLVVGLGMGGEWATGAALVAETWPDAHRGKAMGLMQSAWAIGYAAAATLNAIVLPAFGWRAVFMAGLLPAAVILWIRHRVDESPLWLEGRRQPARGALASVLVGPGARLTWIIAAMNAKLVAMENVVSIEIETREAEGPYRVGRLGPPHFSVTVGVEPVHEAIDECLDVFGWNGCCVRGDGGRRIKRRRAALYQRHADVEKGDRHLLPSLIAPCHVL